MQEVYMEEKRKQDELEKEGDKRKWTIKGNNRRQRKKKEEMYANAKEKETRGNRKGKDTRKYKVKGIRGNGKETQ